MQVLGIAKGTTNETPPDFNKHHNHYIAYQCL